MRVISLTTPDIENGRGYRATLWVAGCRHRCPGCHNQHTWNYCQGKEIRSKEVMDRVVEAVSKPYMRGVTISGGDPLSQSHDSLIELSAFIDEFRHKCPGKDVWIYSGDTFEEAASDELKREVLEKCDVMVDGPFVAALRDTELAFRGSSNQRVIDLEKTFRTGEVHTLLA